MANTPQWNPTLLAALASPNVPDYAGRISQMDLNGAQRDKLLAEIAYMPVQQQNEALKNQAYLLQQGYMIGPDGKAVMTPAKQAELAMLYNDMQKSGMLPDGMQGLASAPGTQPRDLGMSAPSIAPEDVTKVPLMGPTLQQQAQAGAPPALPAGLLLATSGKAPTPNPMVPMLNDQIDAGESPAPAPPQQAQTPAFSLPYNQQKIDMAAKWGKKYPAFGDVDAMIAANKLALDQQKMTQDATQNSASTKGSQKFAEKVSEAAVADLTDKQNKAQDAVLSLQNNSEARNLLNSGIITGSGAEYQVNFGKALQKAGVNLSDDAIANTEAFAALRGKEVATQIKAFGSGTGLSDNDREYAEKMVAGKINLNEKSIRKIIDISDKANANIIKLYNKKAAVYSDVPEAAKAFQPIQLPKFENKAVSTKGDPVSTPDFNGWKIEKVQ